MPTVLLCIRVHTRTLFDVLVINPSVLCEEAGGHAGRNRKWLVTRRSTTNFFVCYSTSLKMIPHNNNVVIVVILCDDLSFCCQANVQIIVHYPGILILPFIAF